MKLVSTESKILYQELEPFDFVKPPVNPAELAVDLIEFMRTSKGVGLSANQLGLPYRVFVMEGEPAFAIFNPKIVDVSTDEVELVEGCLSYPDLWLKIKRPDWVRVRFQMPSGETTTKLFGGYHARVVQHEMEHLNGKVFAWKVKPYDLEKALKIRNKLQRGKLQYVKD